MMNKNTEDMSGGWRMRVALASCLFASPTLLLLDEPTNHLDLEAVVWLGNYLSRYSRCLMVVSHSQDFLNEVCTHTMEITHDQGLAFYTGSYDTYLKTKKEDEANQMKQYKQEQADIAKIKQFIASAGTFSNLVRQAKSKQKILDKMAAKGFTQKPQQEILYNFNFAKCEPIPPPVLSFQNVGFSYSGKKEDYLYSNLNLGVDLDSRIALVGPNGAGKSTLLKLIYNDLQPTEGAIRRHIHLSFGRFHQHSTEALDHKMSPLEFSMSQFPERKTTEMSEWRKAVGRFGISGSMQTKPIETMSEGLKSRVVFAILAQKHPNILLLDEPTNHLDIECIDALARAINKFNGGLLLVSHDFRLIDQVAKEIWICDNNTVEKWKGDIRSYKQSLVDKMKREGLL
jgi:ATP-binding cassette subfamily F protein 2